MQFDFIYYVKFLAAILITNSHFDNLYPLSFLSTGGSIGNGLFFIVSGFCLSKTINQSFKNWMISRCKRLYPTLWVMSVIIGLTEKIPFNLQNIITIIFCPVWYLRYYWFIPAIFLFYIIFYVVVRIPEKYNRLLPIILIIVYGYFYCYKLDISVWVVENALETKLIVSFLEMFVGYCFREKWTVITGYIKKIGNKIIIIAPVFSIIGYCIIRLSTIVFPRLLPIQFIVQFLAVMSSVSLFLTLSSLNLKKTGNYKEIAKKIADATLEIYLFNYMYLNMLEKIIFPLNVLAGFMLILGSGCLMNCIVNAIVQLKKKNI